MNRRIRKSEDLPEFAGNSLRGQEFAEISRMKKGHPRINFFDPGIFFTFWKECPVNLYWLVIEEMKYVGEGVDIYLSICVMAASPYFATWIKGIDKSYI